jgi:hypothetical protein
MIGTRNTGIDVVWLAMKNAWSDRTFGPGTRLKGVIDHIRKELVEVEENPCAEEWADIILLALDGAHRQGYSATEILDAIINKQARNVRREWPDWRESSQDEALHHTREA